MGFEITDGQPLLKKENINPYQYTVSLLKEGYRAGLLDQQTIGGIQEQIMIILKDLILRFTKGESSSVKLETAEKILNSIYYSIDAYLGSLNSPEEGLALLKPKTIRQLYEKGIELVRLCVVDAKILFQAVARQKLDVPLEVYHTLIEEDLPGFFRTYNVVFQAHDTPCNGDYPLVFDDMNLQGVFYIKQYLENLDTETRFCSLFNKEDITRILDNFGRLCDSAYRETPVNLFELLVNTAIFSVLAGNNAANLSLSVFQAELLQRRLKNLNEAAIKSLVDQALENVILDLEIAPSQLTDYLRHYQTIFMERFLNAFKNDNLSNLVLSDAPENLPNNRIVFEEGAKMNDAAFRSVIKQIMACKTVAAKITIITSGIHASKDFLDVLEADCLFGDEFAAVFGALTDVDLAVLGKIVFEEGVGNGPLDLSALKVSETDKETEWERQFVRFVQGLDTDRKQSINRYIHAISS